MALIKLPDGQLVEKSNVIAVHKNNTMTETCVEVEVKTGQSVKVHCDESELDDTLKKVTDILLA